MNLLKGVKVNDPSLIKERARHAIKRRGDCWPTAEQELLLQAALLKGERAVESWTEWKSRVNVEQLDHNSQRLLPLLYRNLSSLDVRDRLIERFKGRYWRTWSKNQLLFHRMAALLRSFHEAGIKTLVLKGAALVVLHYRDYGSRPMQDFDVLVPTKDALRAVELLREWGWTPTLSLPLPEALTSVVHGRGFEDDAGRPCDLHWHLLDECCQPDADDDFWKEAVSVHIHDVATQALNPTDQLLHVCVHGVRWNVLPPLHWVADAMVILSSAHSEIDWQRLVAQTEKRRLILWMRETLNYLQTVFDAPVPAAVLERLQAMPTSQSERREYRYKSESYQGSPLGYLPILWFNFSRLETASSSTLKLLRFIKYLQGYWGVKSLWQLPFYALAMLLRGIRRIIQVHLRG